MRDGVPHCKSTGEEAERGSEPTVLDDDPGVAFPSANDPSFTKAAATSATDIRTTRSRGVGPLDASTLPLILPSPAAELSHRTRSSGVPIKESIRHCKDHSRSACRSQT